MDERQDVGNAFDISISVYSFILTVMVVWVHAVQSGLPAFGASGDYVGAYAAFDGMERIYVLAQIFSSRGLGQLAVPGFFFLSGLLFFRNYRAPQDRVIDIVFFKRKLKRRAFSLIVPYVIWNLVYLAVYAVARGFVPDILTVAEAVINYSYNPVFWYLQQLIIITALTPLMYFLIMNKYVGAAALAACLAAAANYGSACIPYHLFNDDAMLYYMAGAYLSLHCAGVRTGTAFCYRVIAVLAVIFAVCEYIYLAGSPGLYMYGIVLGRLTGVLLGFALVRAAAAAVLNKKGSPRLPDVTKFNFFIYATHYLMLRAVQFAAGLLFGGSMPAAAALILYIAMPFICIAMLAPVGKLLKLNAPAVYGLLTGGR